MYRRLLLASVSLFAVSAAYGADFFWTGAQDNYWMNHNNWGAATAPGSSDDAHFLDEVGTSVTPELLMLPTGSTLIHDVSVDADYYELTTDGMNPMQYHELVVGGDFSVADGKQLAVTGTTRLTLQGGVNLTDNGYALDFFDHSELGLDGAILDGGFIRFNGESGLEVSQSGSSAGGIIGGVQEFYDSSVLDAEEADSITGGFQNFYELSYLYANAAGAVDGGYQQFFDVAQLRATATNAVSRGYQIFSDSSELRPETTGAVGNSIIELRDGSKIFSSATDGLTDQTEIRFSSYGGGAGGAFMLNGYDQIVGTIYSVNSSYEGSDAGVITNSGVADADLTVRSQFDSTFGGVLQNGLGGGALGLIKEGAGKLTLTGTNNTYTGPTTINEGGLVVNGDVSSSEVLVGSLGWLGGIGTVGNTSVLGSGIVRPGNSIGTLHVDGDMVWSADGVYEVEIEGVGSAPTAGHSDLIEITGVLDTSSNPEIRIENLGGVYTAGRQYTIATASSILGVFNLDLINEDISPFLRFHLGQSNDTVFLYAMRNATLASAAETPNQEAVAEAVDGLADGNPVFDMIASLDEEGALAALDAFSGELHASLKGGLIEDSRFVREASLGRLEDRDGEGAGLWTEAYGARAIWGSDGNAAEATRDAHGLFAGADGTVGDFRFGALVGYGQSGYGVVDRGSSATVDSYQAALYGGTVNGPFLLRGGLAYARHDITTRRDVVIEDVDFAATYDTSYGGATTQAFGEAGYRLEMGSMSITPFAGLAYINTSTDGFTEAGGIGALTAAAQSVEQTYAALGLRAAAAFDLGDMSARLHGSLAWRHGFGELAQTAALSIGGSDPYSVAGAPTARDAALVEAGVDVDLSDSATVSALYSGVITESATDQSLKGVLSVKF